MDDHFSRDSLVQHAPPPPQAYAAALRDLPVLPRRAESQVGNSRISLERFLGGQGLLFQVKSGEILKISCKVITL